MHQDASPFLPLPNNMGGNQLRCCRHMLWTAEGKVATKWRLSFHVS